MPKGRTLGGWSRSITSSSFKGGSAERPIRNHRDPELAKVCLDCTKEQCTGTIECMKQRKKELEELHHDPSDSPEA